MTDINWWPTQSTSEVTIKSCAEGFCCVISKVVVSDETYRANKNSIDAVGPNFFDAMNKDHGLRGRPLKGSQILPLHQGKASGVFDGTINNPKDENTCAGYVVAKGRNRFTLNDCIRRYIICKGEDWRRVGR